VAENFYVSLTGADDWLEPTGNWSDALENMARAQRELWEEVGKLPDARLEDVLSAQKQYTVYILLHGVVQHNLYHAGQISLLKKLVVQ
jgi:8-oxo-dGTP pyrophosphatase MutT (NUDIX family)